MVEPGDNAFQLTSNGYEDLVVSVNKKCDGDFSQSEATNLLDNLQVIHYAVNIFYLKLNNHQSKWILKSNLKNIIKYD